jgi:hypothetical protein
MAKKTSKPAPETKKQSPVKKATGAKAASAKATKKKAAPKEPESVEIELDAVEAEAFELAHSSDQLASDLEKAVTSAVTQVIRKVYKQHSISLSLAQAERVALMLFGD